ncbi:MAG: hypothetical protein ABIA21_03515 [Candidatus Aenigmatarchaeota archaeon]
MKKSSEDHMKGYQTFDLKIGIREDPTQIPNDARVAYMNMRRTMGRQGDAILDCGQTICGLPVSFLAPINSGDLNAEEVVRRAFANDEVANLYEKGIFYI